MKIMGHEINENGCQSHSCCVKKPTGHTTSSGCSCIPRVDVATRKKILTRIQSYVHADDLEHFLRINKDEPDLAWASACPECGNSLWTVAGLGRVCDTEGCINEVLNA